MANPKENQHICSIAEESLKAGGSFIQHFPKVMKRIIKDKAWLVREVDPIGTVKLKSLRELITEKPLKGWGTTVDKVQKYIEDDPDLLVEFRENITESKGKRVKDNSDNITIKTSDGRGTNKAYTLDRLHRQAPELYEEVKAGNLSANAAAIKAGFRKKDTPLEAAIKAFNKLSEKERILFIEHISHVPQH